MTFRGGFGVSERRACRVVGQARSTQRLGPAAPPDNELALRAFLRDFARRRPRWGWRRAAVAAKKAGWRANHKRIHRLWIAEGLRVPYRKRKKPLRGIGAAMGPSSPIRPNVVWALDFQFDQTSDGRMLKFLNVIDEFTREALATDVERSIDADGVVACLERLAAERGAPAYVRFDHGPEFIAYARGRLVPLQRNGHGVHRPGLTVAERLGRELQREDARRAPQRSAVRQPARGEGPHRGLADRLQHEQAPLARTAGSAQSSSSSSGSTDSNYSSHSEWPINRGPVSVARAQVVILRSGIPLPFVPNVEPPQSQGVRRIERVVPGVRIRLTGLRDERIDT